VSADATDRLYDLPLESFTAARNELAAELKRGGRDDEAETVRALRKPSVAAWAVNQLARRHARELHSFLDAAAHLRKAQLGGGDVRETIRNERDALERLIGIAGEYAGRTQLPRVRQTLEAAAVDEDAASHVRAGRLERELEPGGFGTLVAAESGARRRRGPDPAARRALEEARKRVAELRRAAHAADEEARRRHEEWRRAEEAASSAARALEEAEQAAAEAEARLDPK
jgi:hypothetical protein